jgi:exopolysaccharide biosynthesis predicted pyruvyltransferase EpsI
MRPAYTPSAAVVLPSPAVRSPKPPEMTRSPAATGALVSELRARLETAVATALDGAQAPVALVDFPNHTNVGDQAIWAGTRRLLARLGVEVRYVADHESYSPRRLRQRVPRGPVLLHGGGSFGDVWPPFQAFRERVIADFPDRRVVLLPQTIEFRDPAALRRAAAALAAHPDCRLLVRDTTSLALAESEFPSARPQLSPDAALMLDLERPAPPETDVVWLSRTDSEREHSGAGHELGVETVDWTGHRRGEPGWTPAYARLHGATWAWGRRARKHPRLWPLVYPLLERGYEALVRERVGVGVAMLSRGRVVVTDRLHAHILCLLLDRPHVVVDTGYGKLTRFIQTWTADAPALRLAGSWSEAAAIASEHLTVP